MGRAGLVKPSWIDTVQLYDLDVELVQVRLIGKLTEENDQQNLKNF